MPKGSDVVEYLSRYTRKVAIGNSRIKALENGKVRFSYFDYRTSKSGEMPLPLHEFVRRFLLHVLPKRFLKVRYYGFMANRNLHDAKSNNNEKFIMEVPLDPKNKSNAKETKSIAWPAFPYK